MHYVDLQVNGYAGVDFNDPGTSPTEIGRPPPAMLAEGVRWALPTIITGSVPSMLTCINNMVSAIGGEAEAAEVFRGLHLEGPFLSPEPGFIGAHPAEHALASDLSALEQLCEAAGPLVRMVTLAPEVDCGGELTRYCHQRGICVAAGHTDATLAQLHVCLDQGLSVFTHLGNGCPRLMDRHDNIIYRALRCRDRLNYTLIADGFHLPAMLFRNLLDWIPSDRVAVVSDAISAAGLGPGTYRLGNREVQIGPDKCARDASGEHFVGAASSLRDAEHWLANALQLTSAERARLLSENAARWMGWLDTSN